MFKQLQYLLYITNLFFFYWYVLVFDYFSLRFLLISLIVFLLAFCSKNNTQNFLVQPPLPKWHWLMVCVCVCVWVLVSHTTIITRLCHPVTCDLAYHVYHCALIPRGTLGTISTPPTSI